MDPGSLIAHRYRIQGLAGAGSMGSVYKARDTASGAIVALKLAQYLSDPAQAQRFVREAEALAGLDHRNIVRYIDHGVSAAGTPYLVMEWLEGVDLAARLRQAPLTEAQAIELGLRVCDALAAAHDRGIIHRDLKPANLFLVGGKVDDVRLIDFGLVRLDTAAMSFPPRPGVLVGTPGFAAPEQVRGDTALDHRVDLYSLGAVLFACLTGRPPFMGNHVMAVLAKLLIEPIPRVSELRADVSPALDQLIYELLAKHAAERPGSAAEVAARLDDARHHVAVPRPARLPEAMSHREQRFFSVLVLGDTSHPDAAAAADHGDVAGHVADVAELGTLAARFDADVQRLADGTVVAVFSTAGDPTEMAVRAARCALALHDRAPWAPLAVATGLGLLEERAPVGRVIDDAVGLAFERDQTRDIHTPGDAAGVTAGVAVDDATAALIDKRFRLGKAQLGYVLLGEAPLPGAARRLLGVETTCVGRDREIATLEAIFAECVDERTPRVVLISGPAGAGKSRVAHELIKQLVCRDPSLTVWTAHGDSLRQGSPLGMLAQLIHQAACISAADSLDVRQARIRERVTERFPEHLADRAPQQRDRVAAFLGEIAGSPFPDHDNLQLRESRRDRGIMHDQMQQAWEDWIAAEADAGPVLLVLEDLHWSDLPSVRFIDSALRNLAGSPLMVLALARPDVHERFPDLWSRRDLEHMSLRALSGRACAELARQVLPEVSDDIIERMARRSGGNPFYLEELLRSAPAGARAGAVAGGAAPGADDDLPDSILAMVSARLHASSAAERRALRAASVFGRNFWIAGVAALLDQPPAELDALMTRLGERELVVRNRTSRFAGEAQYSFHHELIREAAYATLTNEDRVHAHRRAGAWLEHMGETDPVILAEHHWRGQALDRALPWFRRAAEQALEADDLDAVFELARRAVACGARDDILGALRLLQAEAHNWKTEHARACERGLEAMELLPAGTDPWAHAAHQVIWAATAVGDADELVRVSRQLLDAMPAQPSDEYLASLAHPIGHLRRCNRYDESQALDRVFEAHLRARTPGLILAATRARMIATVAVLEGRLDRAAVAMNQAVTLWTQLGSQRHACLDEGNVGWLLCELGQYDRGIDALLSSVARARRTGLTHVRHYHEGSLAIALARSGELGQAGELFDALASVENDLNDLILEANGGIYRAQFALLGQRPEHALEHITRVVAIIDRGTFPHTYAFAMGVRARTLLALGRPVEAVDAAEQAMQVLDAIGSLEEGEAVVRLAHAEALHANGRGDQARQAIVRARQRLLERAERIGNAEWRQSFLERVDEHRRTLALADDWQVVKEAG